MRRWRTCAPTAHCGRLVVRGVDITDAGMPYIGEMTGLRSLDISYTMLGDVGLEHLPS